MKIVEVVAAVILHEKKILCALKGDHKYDYLSNKYEFPGGKVELNETSEQAIIREVFEELNLLIRVKKHLITVSHEYPNFKIELITFLCETYSINNLIIQEHKKVEWLNSSELLSLDWAAADKPIVNYLLENQI
ncbi:(deoxy)nucleoside triphosphate pyrophosphohydrolase [Acinetobacter guillouiae]|uniref:(deoxy)nucleoside triphosphate pyrophosphohydrolase n=1 Tax=Acinetobacter guillouiae TaxID=106649 RepID=UPI0002D0264B|nr:(deoxy)nucleoside triphosphate pyrophosphohydrolase [Acinetobacter guillouiae]ENU59529.1 hypothetical protein F981_01627 [Acinetobacter guillouiae CIP 63.46]KAB0627933.1 (deoxy)nucleoside triphosphate pyrophosphohydrolase [Acinetobacter guillouiae]